MTLKAKVTTAFGSILAIFLLSSVLIFNEFTGYGNSVEQIITERYPQIEHSKTLLNGVNQSLSGLRGWLLMQEDKYLLEQQSAWNLKIDPAIKELKSLSVSGTGQELQLNFQKLEQLGEKFRLSQSDVVSNIKKGTKEASEKAMNILQNNAAPTALELKTYLEGNVELQLSQIKKGFTEIGYIGAFLGNLIFGSTVLAVLLFIVISILIVRSITQPLSYLSGVTNKLSEGDISENIVVDRNDEIGDLLKSIQRIIFAEKEVVATAERISRKEYDVVVEMRGENDTLSEYMNKMLTTLKENERINVANDWLKNGLNELNTLVRGDMQLQKMCDNVINFISRYTSSGVAALYLYHEEKKRLILSSSFAFVERDHLSQEYAFSEGIVGQVAFEKKSILLKNEHRKSYSITTGVTIDPPKNTFTFPMVYEEELIGVIELGAFEEFSGLKQDFLNQAGIILAARLMALKNNLKIKQLLEDAQRSNEELQVQSEELQTANSQLEEQQQQMEEQHQQLESQTVEVRATQKSLEEKNESLETKQLELEQSNKYKSEFLSNMSHELRTPLNSIMLLSGMLKTNKHKNLSDSQVKQLSIINSAGDDLLRLINDILDLSKIEAGKIELHTETFRMEDIATQLKDVFDAFSKEKQIQFEINLGFNPLIKSDEGRVSQILRNLISNAIKFTEKGHVEVHMLQNIHEETKDEFPLRIDVRDTGVGISKDKQARIFEAFQQADNSISRMYGGTGLGLSICKALTQLLNGKLELLSEEGKGSTFSLLLPLELKEDSSSIPSHKPAMISNRIEPGKHILLIEDDQRQHTVISTLLEDEPIEVSSVSTVESAEEALLKTTYDAIILDLILEGRSGYDVLAFMENNKINIPVIIYTGKDISLEEEQKLNRFTESIIIKTTHSDKRLIDDLNLFLKKESVIFTKEQSAESATSLFKGTKILLVDDDIRNVYSMASILEEEDANVITADNGESALHRLSEHENIDLILMDIMMPIMNGFEAMRRIKMDPKLKHIPLIAVTAKAMKSDREECLNAGANDYITKPIDVQNLKSKVKHWIENNQNRVREIIE